MIFHQCMPVIPEAPAGIRSESVITVGRAIMIYAGISCGHHFIGFTYCATCAEMYGNLRCFENAVFPLRFSSESECQKYYDQQLVMKTEICY